MRKSKLISSILTVIGTLGLSSPSQAQVISDDYKFIAGDVLIKKEKLWKTVKILEVDKFENNQIILHTSVFDDVKNKPTLATLENIPVQILHAPISNEAFINSWELLGNQEIKNTDLGGFFEYLKHTNFPRYAEVTNQNVDELIALANAKYKEAYALGQESKLQEAISLYSEAINIFPIFIEAIDNIAFAYMDMGDNEKAIEFFDKSLSIEPKGFTALYYKGQCYINLRDRDSAMAIFKDGMTRFPEKKAAFEEIYLKLKNMRSNG